MPPSDTRFTIRSEVRVKPTDSPEGKKDETARVRKDALDELRRIQAKCDSLYFIGRDPIDAITQVTLRGDGQVQGIVLDYRTSGNITRRAEYDLKDFYRLE